MKAPWLVWDAHAQECQRVLYTPLDLRINGHMEQGGVGIVIKELGLNFLLTGSRLNQPANVIRHISKLGNDDVI